MRPLQLAGAGASLSQGNPHPEHNPASQCLCRVCWNLKAAPRCGPGLSSLQEHDSFTDRGCEGRSAGQGVCVTRNESPSKEMTTQPPQHDLHSELWSWLPYTRPGHLQLKGFAPPGWACKNRKRQCWPKKERCSPHFPKAEESDYAQKPSKLLPGHIYKRKIFLRKQMKPQMGNNCWKRRRDPRDQFFGLVLVEI